MEKHALKFGLMTTLGLIAYFLMVYSIGLGHIVWLRGFNAVLMFAGINMAIRVWRSSRPTDFNWFQGMAMGMMTSAVVGISFALFLVIFLISNPTFLEQIIASETFGFPLNPYMASAIILFEAFFSGYLFSYANMQFLKKPAMAA